MYQLEKQQRNNSSLMSHKDFLIQRLKNQLKSFEEAEHHLEEEMNKKHYLIDSLREDNNSLKDAMELRIIELKNKTQSIEILERHLNELKEKVYQLCKLRLLIGQNVHGIFQCLQKSIQLIMVRQLNTFYLPRIQT